MRFYINNVKYDSIKWEKQQKILPVGIKVLPLHSNNNMQNIDDRY